MRQDPVFEHLGYFKEYYIGSKLIGSMRCEKDREQTGYVGRSTAVLASTITLDNGRKIKTGTEVMTMIYPLNGKIVSR